MVINKMETNNLAVLFFEWSDIKSQPIGFLNVEDFKNFCFNSKITITSNNNLHLNSYKTVYAICKKGKPELVISGNLKGLKKNFNKHNRKVNNGTR